MLYSLIENYIEGKPADEQSECISVLEDPVLWEDFGMGNLQGTDEETDRQINILLDLCAQGHAPQHIVDMLKSWQEEGF